MTRARGTVRTPRVVAALGALGALGLLAVVPAAAPAAASVTASMAASPATSGAPDYTQGPYAQRLCGGGSGDFVCVAARAVAAMTQGADRRAAAAADGATCEVQSGLWVCFGVESVLAQRGGTTYGDTFLTSRGAQPLSPALLAHESEHVRQWQLFGPDFALMYLLEGADACTNYFETTAGLDDGGYTCP